MINKRKEKRINKCHSNKEEKVIYSEYNRERMIDNQFGSC